MNNMATDAYRISPTAVPMKTGTENIVICVEHSLYRRYLDEAFEDAGISVRSIDQTEIAQAISEKPSSVLVLQSDSDEHALIELSSRLKRLFEDEIRILLMSANHRTAEESGNSIDLFLQYPVAFEEVCSALAQFKPTRRRILLIDDSNLAHSVLVPPLEDEGYEIFQAFDGAEGLEMARKVSPDLIICDIEMPQMNGFEVCASIRATVGIAETYVIMSSTLGSAADQQKGFAAGVDEYLTKPVVVPELIDRIQKFFSSASTGRENVLIVETNDQVSKSMQKSIAKQGFSTRATSTIKDAVRILKRVPNDVVISGTDLGDGSVIDLFNALNTLPEDRQPDVLIIASRDSRADQKMVMNAGAAGIISKPFTMDSLLASLERTVADRRARQERVHLEKYVSIASRRMAIEKSILSGKTSTTRAYQRQATIFFSDIVDFTTRCEKYTAREVVEQINTLFSVMTRVIMESGGDIDKFIGDACMAYWLDEDTVATADCALRTVLRMRAEVASMNQSSPILSGDPISIRIGINTGEIILCDLGAADARIDLTIIGDPVNVAARLESAAKQYGIDNLISGSAIGSLLDRFEARLIDRMLVKGKNEPVDCYELLGEKGEVEPHISELVDVFSQGTMAYFAGEFEPALRHFEAADALEDSTAEGLLNPSRLYQKRCRHLLENPPNSWEGIWELTEK